MLNYLKVQNLYIATSLENGSTIKSRYMESKDQENATKSKVHEI